MVITAGLFGLGQTAAHLRTDEADSWLFAYYGARMIDGELLYGDAWDNKPPGIFWVNAFGLLIGGGHYGGVIALCVLGSAAALLLFYRTARGWFGAAPAALGAMLAALYLSHQLYRGGTNRPETFVVLFDLAAVYCYQLGLRGGAKRYWVLAGAMVGVSFVFKQTGVAALVAIVLHQILLTFRSRPLTVEALQPLGLILLGWFSSFTLAVIGLLFTGDLKWAWDAVVLFVLRYAAARPGPLPTPELFGLPDHLHTLALPLILAAGGVVYVLFHLLRFGFNATIQGAASSNLRESQSRSIGTPQRRDQFGVVGLLVCWFLVAAFLVFTGPTRAYHYVPTALTPLLLLATYTIELLIQQRAEQTRLPPYALRYVAVIWFVYMGYTPLKHQLHQLNTGIYMRTEQEGPFGDETVVDFIVAQTEKDDRIFLWHYLPRIYWATRRPCGSRFHSMLNVSQLGREGQYIIDDILLSFRAEPPKLVTLSYRRAQALRDDDPQRGPDFRELAAFLCERYHPVDPRNPDSILILADDDPG